MIDLKSLVVRLFEARRERDAAHEACVDKAIEVGPCQDERNGVTCWQHGKSGLCEACEKRVPLWEARKVARAKAGAALRAVIRAGRILSKK